MILLGNIFTFLAKEILLYISSCGVKLFSEEFFLFSLHKKITLYVSGSGVK